MKKVKMLAALLAVLLVWLIPLSVTAEESTTAVAPVLESIEFKNAVINEPFVPDTLTYTLTLEDPTLTPTLKSYAIDGEAELFVTDILDEAKHKTGVQAKLVYGGDTKLYTFAFTNAEVYADSGNNYLAEVTCPYGEVYPAINEKQTEYTLYIASDLTALELNAVTEDIGATCELSPLIELGENQELPISANVIASNGDTRTYTFKIKRLKMTCDEVREAMENPNFKTLVKAERFLHNPVFWIACGAVVVLLLLAVLAWRYVRRMRRRATAQESLSYDKDKESDE